MTAFANDNGAPVAITRRWQRERGFTRGAFVVVPEWENIDARCDHDDCIAERMHDETHAEALALARALGIGRKRTPTRTRG